MFPTLAAINAPTLVRPRMKCHDLGAALIVTTFGAGMRLDLHPSSVRSGTYFGAPPKAVTALRMERRTLESGGSVLFVHLQPGRERPSVGLLPNAGRW